MVLILLIVFGVIIAVQFLLIIVLVQIVAMCRKALKKNREEIDQTIQQLHHERGAFY